MEMVRVKSLLVAIHLSLSDEIISSSYKEKTTRKLSAKLGLDLTKIMKKQVSPLKFAAVFRLMVIVVSE